MGNLRKMLDKQGKSCIIKVVAVNLYAAVLHLGCFAKREAEIKPVEPGKVMLAWEI